MFIYLILYTIFIFQYVFLVNNKNTYKNINIIFYKHYCKKVTIIITKIFLTFSSFQTENPLLFLEGVSFLKLDYF